MAARTAYLLAGMLLAGVMAAAFVSRNESREDFIIRQRVGEFDINAPSLNAPNVEGPEIDGPNVDGPQIDGPQIGWADIAYTAVILILIVGLITALVLILRRFGPGARDDAIDSRTIRLDANEGFGSYAGGEEGWAAFEQFCYELLQDPDPSRAVRVTMRYAEAGLGRLDARIADETPNEWLRRTRADQTDLARHLAPIVASYNSVRFGGNGASPAERDVAVDGLRRLARTACGQTAPGAPAPIAGGQVGPT